jgi:hypothetical protein
MDRGGDRRSDDFKGSNDPLKPALTIHDAATALKVSPATVKRARKRKAVDPEAHEQAKAGIRPRAKPTPRPKPPVVVAHEVDEDEAGLPAHPVVHPHDASKRAGYPPVVEGACKAVTGITSGLVGRVWRVRHCSYNRSGPAPVALQFTAPAGGKASLYEIDGENARAMGQALIVYADWLAPERSARAPAPDPTPAPEQLQKPAAVKLAPATAITERLTKPVIDRLTKQAITELREWAATVGLDRLTKHVEATGLRGSRTQLESFLAGKDGSYHLRHALAQVRADPSDYS